MGESIGRDFNWFPVSAKVSGSSLTSYKWKGFDASFKCNERNKNVKLDINDSCSV
ncbi:hypothetical protein RRG08_021202 [Elysia crispata]|uniref:Uncharacterized protein n=1 Tax=Elysia crispata TaxID=231223 RepID=A0AAE0YNZ7_9GAST|nr:hypothetical protein RRG08_021202 [Elysia crispata]